MLPHCHPLALPGGSWAESLKQRRVIMHIEKCKSGQVVGYLLHDTRKCENHTNEKIDSQRSELNYNLVAGNPFENFKSRMDQVYMRKNKNANVLAMISTTLPKDFPAERSEEFFQKCHDFFCEKFGRENIISDIVHRDETTDHMHTKFIPVYFDTKKQRETVSFDKVVNRNVYRNIHKDLQNYLEKEFGFEVHILNGATANGNKTIAELKTKELEKQNEQLKKQNDEMIRKNNMLQQKINEQNLEIEKQRKEIIKLKLEKKSLIERIKELIDMIRPIERLKNLIWTIKTFADDFIDFEENLCVKYDLTEQEFKILNENVDIINTTDDLDDLIDKISDMQKELDQKKSDNHEMTR